MSKTTISLIVIGALVVGVVGLWWVGALEGLTSALNLNILQEEMVEEEVPQATPQSDLTTGSDTSDEALEEDLGTLDAQLDSYGETSSELDAGLEDEPVEQDTNF